MIRRALRSLIYCCSMLACAPLAADDAAPSFDAQIAIILKQHCQECHGKANPKSGLKLNTAAEVLRGGESGPAVIAGDADKSLLIQLIASGEMPPEGKPRVSADQFATLRNWIAAGAPGAEGAKPLQSDARIAPEAQRFAAFRALSPPAVPDAPAGGLVHNPIDAFIRAQLSAAGLHPAPEADKLTLLRRACFDLHGLPPTLEQIDAFISDEQPDAFEQLLDRLLASPRFGERWGRHWLDAAGYSDITGGDNDAGIIKLSAGKWKYRDYVVRSFNHDKPYEQFLLEQLAGDELTDWRTAEQFSAGTQELLIATGFLRNAADDTDEKELTTPDILNGVLQRTCEVVANNLLGLTLACAKCHDHKYEPIPQQDYYRLIAAFTPAFNPTSWVQPKNRALADIAPSQKAEAEKHNAELDRQIEDINKHDAELKRPAREQLFAAKLEAVSSPIRADVRKAIETSADKRNEVQKYLVEKFKADLDVTDALIVAALSEEQRAALSASQRRLKELQATRVSWGTIQAAYDVGPPPETHVLRRGNHETPGPIVEPGFLNVLCATTPASTANATTLTHQLPARGATSGRRLALARWLTEWNGPAGGLTARVWVNRIWQHLFGRGIVETTENLGVSGAKPSHPELLEWLSCEFVASGRQLKPLVKRLMTSAVYRQASLPADAVDPDNRLLAHMPLKRLEAEVLRDAILTVSGQLDPTIGGPAVGVEVRADGMVVIDEKNLPSPSARSRRSLYVLARRNYHLSMLGVFDQPAMSTNCPLRQPSAVVLQSLAMLNDDFIVEQARHLAKRVNDMAPGGSADERVRLVFRLALGRLPKDSEIAWSQELLRGHQADLAAAGEVSPQADQRSLTHLCQMLLATSEFLYVP